MAGKSNARGSGPKSAPGAAVQTGPRVHPARTLPSHARVLVIAPDAGSTNALAAVLRAEGYHLTLAARLDEVVQTAERPDIILAALEDDGAQPHEFIAALRQAAPGAQIIVLASYAALDAALRALRAGAYDYLATPVDVDELRATFERVSRQIEAERQVAAHVAALEAAHAHLREANTDLQRRVDEATRELQRQVVALDEANTQLRATQEQHHTFVAMVAHEMRGPLGPIMNYAQMAKRPSVTPEKRGEYMDIIVEHAHRMNRLVDDLQTATRLSTGRFALQYQHTDVVAAVAGLVEQFTVSHRDRQFLFERPSTPILADVDPDRVLQAVRNLTDNAIKYSAEGGAIELRVWQDTQRVYIQVGDFGAGIPETERERIFQPFTRLERRPNPAGTGLGLYITRGIAAAHGGELSVANREGNERAHGAIFTLALPLLATTPTGSEQPPTR